jgi:hypothetical protein
MIRTHLIYDCKHDGRHKVRMVADGHLTDIPLESMYSRVVSLCRLRIVTFLAELNGLDLWATDIGNAYLEAFTMEQNDHPEMDDSPFLGQDETQQFQSLIGAMQWAESIGRLDIATAIMSLPASAQC